MARRHRGRSRHERPARSRGTAADAAIRPGAAGESSGRPRAGRPASGRRTGRRLAIEDLVSFGGIVYRSGSEGPEFVLCGRSAIGLWGLPKGTPIPGETQEETARREVREETGLEVGIERKAGEIEYWFTRAEQGKRFHKRVHYYLMRPTGGDVAQHDHEYDIVQWFTAAKAVQALTYDNEADMLRRALALIEAPDSEGG